MWKKLSVWMGIFVSVCGGGAVAQKNYMGRAKHPAPVARALPEASAYNFGQVLTGSLREKLERSLTEILQKQPVTGLTATLVVPGQGTWQRDTGFVNRPEEVRVNDSTLFYWASVGKLITGTVMAQLIREKKVSARDPLLRRYPQFAHADDITIDHLLTHTSGLYSFNADSVFHNSNRFHTPDELLAIAQSKGNLFAPGEYWSYSNTGYLLLALIAEKVEGKPFARIVEERISRPLGLSSLKILEPGEQPGNLALAHRNDSVLLQQYSLPLGAGNLVARSGDMARFLHALLSGKIIPKTDVLYMLRDLYPMFNKEQYYGRGIMFYDFSAQDWNAQGWIGHSGGTENYRAVLAYDVRSQAIVAVAANEYFPVEAAAYRWFRLVWDTPQAGDAASKSTRK